MQKAQLTWYIEDKNNSFVPYEEYYAGSFTPNDFINLKICLWNNRWGQENIANANNIKLFLYFENLEDSMLLDMCSIRIDNGTSQKLEIDSGKGVISLNRNLSGDANDGSLKNVLNYCVIDLSLGPIQNGFKNTIKNLYISPDFNSISNNVI